ncbi:molybdopterin-dependent oxidoreductase [Helicovermis profundi]|uniref:Molybdopterin-dependent oxidoreductase n=1 Tax=Helicovermis profundi TaxID=3065157 RepID=A0AAU9EFW7_9FIRM|nr:molybdopterin-dependent oxidoreductase [Clostridia bacterium S502]
MEKKSVCSLDCFDLCSISAQVKNNKIISLTGDKNNPITKGFICYKGKEHLNRLYSENRIKTPLLKENGVFNSISYDKAIKIVSEKLKEAITFSNDSVLYNYDSGYGGISKEVGSIFFNSVGGAVTHSGSLCWGAGISAQKYDFGISRSNHPSDLLNSKLIILWGRNPVDTNIHLVSYINEARKNGAKVILIDPIKTNSIKISDEHLFIEPSTDGLLALGIANYLASNNLIDNDFISKYTKGFKEYKEHLKKYDLTYVSDETGISKEKIIELANELAKLKTTIILGYGMQRYQNGGNSVRAIDSLLALTGNIGREGSSATYANKSITKLTSNFIKSFQKYDLTSKKYSKAKLGRFLKNSDNKIKFMWVEKSNPVTQSPNSLEVIEGMKKVDFKVVVDMFMTDTAMEADLVFPTTSILEEEDFIYSSMFSPYLVYGEEVIKPLYGIISEFELYKKIAKQMDNVIFPMLTKDEYFNKVLNPILLKENIALEELKKINYIEKNTKIAWKNKQFMTPSKKYEFYSDKALKETGIAMPTYFKSQIRLKDEFRFISPHHVKSLHSQGYRNNRERPIIYINDIDFEKLNLIDEELVSLSNKNGKVIFSAKKSCEIKKGTIYSYEGRWLKDGGPNLLTNDLISDMGEQAAYYDTFCRIEKIKNK